jgi:hypothetical protein
MTRAPACSACDVELQAQKFTQASDQTKQGGTEQLPALSPQCKMHDALDARQLRCLCHVAQAGTGNIGLATRSASSAAAHLLRQLQHALRQALGVQAVPADHDVCRLKL